MTNQYGVGHSSPNSSLPTARGRFFLVTRHSSLITVLFLLVTCHSSLVTVFPLVTALHAQGGGPPGGGTVQAIAIDPVTSNTLYVGAEGGGVHKSTDGGATWTGVNSGLTDTLVTALAIDPDTPTTLYAGTEEGGVFKSTNGGTSWTAVNSGLTNTEVNDLVIDPSTPSTLYA